MFLDFSVSHQPRSSLFCIWVALVTCARLFVSSVFSHSDIFNENAEPVQDGVHRDCTCKQAPSTDRHSQADSEVELIVEAAASKPDSEGKPVVE